ncbi:MAG: TIGR02117 family protein [Alphaproteobacteria bacterium]|nr:TIGR02117 family protein [Alphaproteobacteria bacterium]
MGDRTTRGWKRAIGRGLIGAAALIALYAVAAVTLGLLPANRGYVAPAEGIELSVVSNGFHADLIVPMQAAGIDWRAWCPPEKFGGAPAAHIGFGWGDKDFFVETRTLQDVTLTTALKAVSFSRETALHVMYVDDVRGFPARKRLIVSPETYRALADYIQASFKRGPTGRPIARPEPGYGPRDAFFDATGTYSPLRTCNEWLAEGLRQAGLPTGWWSPFAFGVTAHL